MSAKYPITVSSWTLGDKCTFEERVSAAKNAGFEGIGLRSDGNIFCGAHSSKTERIMRQSSQLRSR